MEQQSPKISGNLRGAAIGATLAMLPMALIAFLFVLKIIKEPDRETEKIFIVFQFIGCLIWAISLTSSVSKAKQLGIKSSGIGLCILGIILGGIIQLIFAFDRHFQKEILHFTYDFESSLAIITLITAIINIPLVAGTAIMRNKLRAFSAAITTYSILALYPIITFIIVKILAKSIRSDEALRNLLLLLTLILLISIIISIIAWFRAAFNAKVLEEDAENGDDNFAPQATYVEQPAAAPVQPATPTQPQQNYSARPVSAITEEQKKILMGMTNQELTNVINNPSLYANPAFVDEARKTLTKRQGWEIIKDYSDEQLLSIVHDNVQGFSSEVLDAASMELLARENATFINEVASLSVPELQGILSNADSYYDGYIQLATRVLNERINNPGSTQA